MGKLRATILTGFLGSGKTTLLNHLISQNSNQRIAIIVNEYGDVGIDGKLVVETQDTVIELNNGCICCTVRGDLIAALGDLLRSGRAFDRIIIETSGLADPAPVIQSFILDDLLAERVVLDAVVTVVDARHTREHLALDEAMEQISFADVLLLNKIDLETEDALDGLEAELRRLNPLARILRTQNCAVPPGDVLDLGAFDLKAILRIAPDLLDDHDHEHDRSIGAVALQSDEPVDAAAFDAWLSRLVQDIGRDLFRTKGIVSLHGERRRYVFHGVHMMLEGRPGRPWLPSETPSTRIVLIGRHLDEAALRRGFTACLHDRLHACPHGETALAS